MQSVIDPLRMVICAGAVLCCSARLAGAASFNPSNDPVFRKMLTVNSDLRSYTAHIDVKTHFRFLSYKLRGTLYAKGHRTKIRFDKLPGIARSSVENQPSIGAPATWPSTYDMSIAVRDARRTIFHLVPRGPGSGVAGIDVTVANRSGLVQRYLWTNTNGTTIASDQTYAVVNGHELPSTSRTQVGSKGRASESETTFSDYRLNVDVPDSVFVNR